MNTEQDSSNACASHTGHQVTLDLQLRRYRNVRRRKVADRLARKEPIEFTGEAGEILRFALIWAPYGGAPAEETFQKFGMAPRRFAEKLWQTVEELGCGRTITSQFASVYAHPGPG